MNIWIRSQDKETLAVPVQISIVPLHDSDNKPTGEYGIISFTEMAGDIDLGIYKSKERAIEVLDEINEIKWYKYMAYLDWQHFINIIYHKPDAEKDKIFAFMNTYEMPAE